MAQENPAITIAQMTPLVKSPMASASMNYVVCVYERKGETVYRISNGYKYRDCTKDYLEHVFQCTIGEFRPVVIFNSVRFNGKKMHMPYYCSDGSVYNLCGKQKSNQDNCESSMDE